MYLKNVLSRLTPLYKYFFTHRIRLKTFKAHSRRISSLAVSVDGLTMVSVGWDGECKIWSGRGHREVSTLKGIVTRSLHIVTFKKQKNATSQKICIFMKSIEK